MVKHEEKSEGNIELEIKMEEVNTFVGELKGYLIRENCVRR